MSNNKKFIVEYTTKDIMDKLEIIEHKLDNRVTYNIFYSAMGIITTSFLFLISFITKTK